MKKRRENVYFCKVGNAGVSHVTLSRGTWRTFEAIYGLKFPSVREPLFQKNGCFIGTFGMWDFACLTPYPSWSWLRFDVMCKGLDQVLHAVNLLFFETINFSLLFPALLASREGKKRSIGGGRNQQQSTMTWRWKIEKSKLNSAYFFPAILKFPVFPLKSNCIK